jgi:hypothetical protein
MLLCINIIQIAIGTKGMLALSMVPRRRVDSIKAAVSYQSSLEVFESGALWTAPTPMSDQCDGMTPNLAGSPIFTIELQIVPRMYMLWNGFEGLFLVKLISDRSRLCDA